VNCDANVLVFFHRVDTCTCKRLSFLSTSTKRLKSKHQ